MFRFTYDTDEPYGIGSQMFVVLPRVGTTEGCQLQSKPDMTQEVGNMALRRC